MAEKKTTGTESEQQGIQRRGEEAHGLARRHSWESSPFSFMRRFSEEMDRLFEDFGFASGRMYRGGGQIPARQFGRGLWNPPIEVLTRGDELIVRAELPGLKRDDVKVECTSDAITIEGERRYESEGGDEDRFHTERSYGRFARTIVLPEGTKIENAKATFTDGVLEIKMKAPEETKSRQIKI